MSEISTQGKKRVAQSAGAKIGATQAKARRSSAISAAAKLVINERKRLSRPFILAELSALVTARAGQVTDQEMFIIACVLSYLISAQELAQTLIGWLANASVSADVIGPFLQGKTWLGILGRAQAAERGENRVYRLQIGSKQEVIPVDPRRDFSIRRIHAEFKVTDFEATAIGLTLLVSERLRSKSRRKAEGVGQVAPDHDEPSLNAPRPDWEVEGISRATWYRRREKDKAQERAAAVRFGATLSVKADKQPGQQNGSTAAADAEEAGILALLDKDTDRVAASLIRTWRFRTAEARRLAALAKRLGFEASGGIHSIDAANWWIPTTQLEPCEAAAFDQAVLAASAAEERVEAVAYSRERRRVSDRAATARRVADEQIKCSEREAELKAAHDRGDRPKRVSEAAWSMVPEPLRPRVRFTAGRFFLWGYSPDRAVALGTICAVRESATTCIVLAADALAEPLRVKELVESFYWYPVALTVKQNKAVETILRSLATERLELMRALSLVTEAAAAASVPLFPDEFEWVIARAARILISCAITRPADAIRDARDEAHIIRVSRLRAGQ